MKLVKYIFVFVAVGFLAGCMGMSKYLVKDDIVQGITQEPVYERFYIHKNAKVGDKAVLVPEQSEMRLYKSVMTLIKKEGDLNVISSLVENNNTLDMEHFFWVTDDGWVKKAKVRIMGEMYPLKVAGVADAKEGSYIKSAEFKKLVTPQKLNVHGTTYTIRYMLTKHTVSDTKSQSMFMGDMKSEVVTITLIDPSVPFGSVKIMMSGNYSANQSAIDGFVMGLTKAATAAMPADTMQKLYSQAQPDMDDVGTGTWAQDFYYEKP